MSRDKKVNPLWSDDQRKERRFRAGDEDQRSHFERDRDRVLYCSAFRRLGGVSQVVSADHIEPFHNRLTHTIKVAQLGRRLAQYLCDQQPDETGQVGLDPEVVEASCLIHDLGHPPFGHIGEEVLAERVISHGDPEGYEGNAQSFRIVTKLALRSPSRGGLDLTRAVLCASLKYPWGHAESKRKGTKKFGHFQCETDDFGWCRLDWMKDSRTIEAAIMDYADDIAYSVHDLEDFHRIRAVPWHLMQISRRRSKPETRAPELIDAALRAWYDKPVDARARLNKAAEYIFGNIKEHAPIYNEPYEGTRDQRVSLRNWTSDLIRRFVRDLRPKISVRNGTPVLVISSNADAEIRLLKQITRTFIIDETIIGAQQFGQRRVVHEVFDVIVDDIALHRSRGAPLKITPKKFHYLMEDSSDGLSNSRLAADCVSSLTERELIALHHRLTGQVGGSIVDPIVR